ncbi:MAG: ISKra4 family transposase [Dehalococcoidia bacterium]|nr:ISKra4 family transposase [Dehalococcoidia bacterium]
MDRGELSPSIIQEMGELFVRELSQVAPELVQGDLDGIEQTLQGLGRRVLGRVAEETIAVIEAGRRKEAVRCPHCHHPMRLVDAARPRSLQGLVGDYQLVRAYFFYCDRCPKGYAPLDEQLGIGPGLFSPGLARVACRLGIEKSFPEAADALGEALHMTVIDESVRRTTEGIGEVAEAEQQAAVARAKKGDEPVQSDQEAPATGILAVEVDGAMIHLEKEWHETKVGVVSPLGPKEVVDHDSGRVHLRLDDQSYCVGLEKAEEFWYRVYAEACRRGLGGLAVVLVVVLGDGADWIWRYARQFVGIGSVQVVEIVDIFHAFEHLWTVANAVFGAGSAKATEWAKALQPKLEQEGVGPVLEALGQLETEDEGAAKEVRKALAYFTEHAERMDYPRFIALKLPIGSGAVECACKVILEEREKGAGMRWSYTGAQAVASLRALHRSGRWKEFWQTHPQRRRPPVPRSRHPAVRPLARQAA